MKKSNARVLIVESDSAVASNIIAYLDNYDLSSDVVSGVGIVEETLQNNTYDVIVVDQQCMYDEKHQLLQSVRNFDKNVDVVVMLNSSNFDLLLGLSRQGISKFIVKPFTSTEFGEMIIEGVRSTQKNREYDFYTKNRNEIESFLRKRNIDFSSMNELLNV